MKYLFSLMVIPFLFFSAPTQLSAVQYDHTIELDRMSFAWKLDGKNIHIQLKAKTKGWVAVGFNPKKAMQGANFIIGYVKRRKVKIQDEYGIRLNDHIRDVLNQGENNISNVTGKESRGVTTISFTIPLNSGDESDTKIDPKSMNKVLLAFGPAKDDFHTKHVFRTALNVNLKTGAYNQ